MMPKGLVWALRVLRNCPLPRPTPPHIRLQGSNPEGGLTQ